MMIPVLRDRTTKPPMGTPLRSDGHWSVQGNPVVIAYNEGGGSLVYDASGTIPPGSHNGIFQNGDLSLTGTQFLTLGLPNALKITSLKGFSIVSICTPTLDGTSRTIIRSDEGAPRIIINLSITSADKVSFTAGNANETSILTGLLSIRSGVIQSIVATNETKNNGTATIYINGVFDNNASNINGGVYWEKIVGDWETRYSGTFEYNGVRHLDIIYPSTVLTPNQIVDLSANPWQIYEPETVWIEAGGGVDITEYPASSLMGM